MNEINHQKLLGSEFDMAGFCGKFEAIASEMYLSNNDGGMHVAGLFNLAIALSMRDLISNGGVSFRNVKASLISR